MGLTSSSATARQWWTSFNSADLNALVDQALKGNLPGAVQQGVVRALTSHQKLATLVLKSDRQAMAGLTDVIYELIRDQKNIDLGDLNV